MFVYKFFHSRYPKKDLSSLEVIIVDGDLYKDDEFVYGAFFLGSEDVTSLQVKKGDKLHPFAISTDMPMIIVGNYDKYLLETTLVHELFHFMVPDRHGGEYATDPDEIGARNFERLYLKKVYRLSDHDVELFMKEKYLKEIE